MKSKKILTSLILSGVLLSGGAAFAEEGKGPKERGDFAARKEARFKKADADNDGKISKEEFLKARQEKLEEHFKQIDANSDGFLTKDEFKEFRKSKRAEWKKRFAERLKEEEEGEDKE